MGRSPADFESAASANSAIPAWVYFIRKNGIGGARPAMADLSLFHGDFYSVGGEIYGGGLGP
jgi:hypothetical protein